MKLRAILANTAAVAAVLSVIPVMAVAQSASGASDDTDETVVVTARKREETIIQAPVAVTAVGAADIARLGVQSVDDLARFTPGLSFSRAFGRSSDRPVLRGAANILATVQAGVESGTAFFVDGVYYQGDIQSLDSSEIERIEVIKGPQSALYGRNTYSGAINYITRSPGDVFSMSGMVYAGEHDEQTATLRVAGPINDWISASLSGRYMTFGGEWANSAVPGETLGAEQSTSFATVVDMQPTEQFRLRTRISYQEDDDGPRAFGLQTSDANNCFPGYRSNQFRGAPGTTNNNPNQYFCGVIRDSGVYNQNTATVNGGTLVAPPFTWRNVIGAPYMGVAREVWSGSIIGTVDLDGGHRVTVQGGARREYRRTGSDSDFQNLGSIFGSVTAGVPSVNGLFQLSSESNTEDMSLEIRVESPDDRRVRWLVGLYGYELQTRSRPMNFLYGAAANFTGPMNTFDGTINSAYFGRVSIDLTDTLTLDLEGRQQVETKINRDIGDATTAARPLGVVLFNDERQFSAFTPRATLSWQPSDSLTVYGIYAQGAKPGGLNGLIGVLNNRPIYEQEESTNLELGVKYEFMDRRGRITAAIYRTEAEQYQLTTTIADITGSSATGLTSVVTNQGDAEIQGLELDARFRFNEYLAVAATYSWVDTEFTRGCDDFQYTLESGGFVMSATCDVPLRTTPTTVVGGPATPLAGASGSIVGNRIPLVPEHQASFNFNFNYPIGASGLEFFASGDVSYESSKYVQVHNLAETGETVLVGGRLGLSNDNWRFSVVGRNLTDEDSIPIATRWFDLFQGTAAAAGVSGAAATGLDTGSPRAFFYSPRRGRSIGAELRVNF